MMNKILYPGKEEWAKVVERPVNKGEDLEKVCKALYWKKKRMIPLLY